ncbi:hypothetical protein ABKN59_005461 [Abortiporus biennis]
MNGPDIFNLIAAIVGVMAFLYAVIEKALPSTRLASLEKSFRRADSLLHECSEEGVVRDFQRLFTQLKKLKAEGDVLAARTHQAATLPQQILEMCKGLSWHTYILQGKVRALIAYVASQKLIVAQRNITSQSYSSSLLATPVRTDDLHSARSDTVELRPTHAKVSGAEAQSPSQLPIPRKTRARRESQTASPRHRTSSLLPYNSNAGVPSISSSTSQIPRLSFSRRHYSSSSTSVPSTPSNNTGRTPPQPMVARPTYSGAVSSLRFMVPPM